MPPPTARTSPPTRIVGSRVVLAQHRLERAGPMFDLVYANRARLAQWLPWVETTVSLADEQSYIRHTLERWKDASLFDFAVLRRGDEVFCGNCGVHTLSWPHARCEIGYWIGADYEGMGYVTEAVRLLEQAMFAVGMHRIEIRCDPDNLRSQVIPQRLGYMREGLLRGQTWRDDQWRDTVVFAKIAPTPVL